MRLVLVALATALASGGPASAATFLETLLGRAPLAAPPQTVPQRPAPAPNAPLFGGFAAPGYGYGNSDQQYSGRVLYPDQVSPYRTVPPQFRRQTVTYRTAEAPGTIIVDTRQHFLYLVTGNDQAIRYGVGVGRQGFGWKGTVRVGDKNEWPDWRPPAAMIAREKARGHILPAFMPGGPNNPLGARALYLHNGNGDTGYRIHGTSEPWTIGLNVSSGCIRLNNDDVVDLYQRVPMGTKVIVM
jgi:lipoprotein-anchoring transpeptidase ErfK/SrfK